MARSHRHEIDAEIEELPLDVLIGANGEHVPLSLISSVKFLIGANAADDWEISAVYLMGREPGATVADVLFGEPFTYRRFRDVTRELEDASPLRTIIVEAAERFARADMQSAVDSYFEDRHAAEPGDRADREYDRVRDQRGED